MLSSFQLSMERLAYFIFYCFIILYIWNVIWGTSTRYHGYQAWLAGTITADHRVWSYFRPCATARLCLVNHYKMFLHVNKYCFSKCSIQFQFASLNYGLNIMLCQKNIISKFLTIQKYYNNSIPSNFANLVPIQTQVCLFMPEANYLKKTLT